MFLRLITLLRPHYVTIATLIQRDVLLVLGTGLFMCALCWSVGHPGIALLSGICILVLEGVVQLLFRRIGPFNRVDKTQTLVIALLINTISAIAYCLPAVYLAGEPSLAIKITGLLYIVGVQIYITNTWLRVPPFVFAMLVPTFGMLVLSFLNLAQTIPTASPQLHWMIALAALVIFIYGSIDTLRQHVVTQRTLFSAQKQSSSRLNQLEQALRQDTLTKLLTRPAFDTALSIMLDERATSGGNIAVFLLDLDNFKPINDTYTHDAGDAVLIQTAGRLQAFVGASGIVGRLGGDEFICALHDLEDSDAVFKFGEALGKNVARAIHWDERTFKVAASIGAASTHTGALTTVPALCSAADQAMFASKSSPNNQPVLYDVRKFAPRMTPQDKQRLIDGIQDHSLKPYYQPKVHLTTGQIIGYEALARWENLDDDIRQPADFITQIFELGLQADFMMSLADQVVKDINAFLDAGLDPGQISLNLSEIALATHSGREDLKRVLKANPKVTKHLTFEITEDVFIARSADTIQASIASFRALGVRVSLDDFGTGFASFHHLRQLDFDELKIDTSFVAGLGHDATAEVLVRGVLSIASGLGVSVVAEGVETEAQKRDLINMGCLIAQGFLFSPAVPVDAAIEQLTHQQIP